MVFERPLRIPLDAFTIYAATWAGGQRSSTVGRLSGSSAACFGATTALEGGVPSASPSRVSNLPARSETSGPREPSMCRTPRRRAQPTPVTRASLHLRSRASG
jgi:hypothetical protein